VFINIYIGIKGVNGSKLRLLDLDFIAFQKSLKFITLLATLYQSYPDKVIHS